MRDGRRKVSAVLSGLAMERTKRVDQQLGVVQQWGYDRPKCIVVFARGQRGLNRANEVIMNRRVRNDHPRVSVITFFPCVKAKIPIRCRVSHFSIVMVSTPNIPWNAENEKQRLTRSGNCYGHVYGLK